MASKRVAAFRPFQAPAWTFTGLTRRCRRHAIHGVYGALVMGLVACVVGGGPVIAAAQETGAPPRQVLRLYSGPCHADDALPQAGAQSESPQIVAAPPFEAALFAMEIDGTIAGLVSGPLSLAVVLIDGELTVVEACGDLPPQATGKRLVISLLSPVTGALVGVADVAEPAPGQLTFLAYLMLADPAGNDIPVDSTDEPQPGDDDDEQPGGV